MPGPTNSSTGTLGGPIYDSGSAGGDVLWTITASSTQVGIAQISTTLQADGADTAPDSWVLTAPDSTDESSSLSGTSTVTFCPNQYGLWVLQALDASANVLASRSVLVQFLVLDHLVEQDSIEIFTE